MVLFWADQWLKHHGISVFRVSASLDTSDINTTGECLVTWLKCIGYTQVRCKRFPQCNFYLTCLTTMSVFYYEPFYDFDRFFDNVLSPRTVRNFGGDQRHVQGDATPEGAIRALKPRFVISCLYPGYNF